jgi:hypothetical protein
VGAISGNEPQGDLTMREIILSLTFASALALSGPAAADSKSAAEFVLKTCLAAMDDLSKVEVMAREGNWFTFPPRPVTDPNMFASKTNWRANKFFVSTWTNKKEGNAFPVCFVGLGNDKTIIRDEFFNAISASVELKLVSETSPSPQLRMEAYDIKSDGPSKVQLLIAAHPDGSMSSIMFSNCSASEPTGWCYTTP